MSLYMTYTFINMYADISRRQVEICSTTNLPFLVYQLE